MRYRGGFHDFEIRPGGLSVYPRLVAARHGIVVDESVMSTGLHGLDALLGGGLVRGTATLLIGPAGVGKTTTAVQCMVAGLERGEKAAYFLFDERVPTLLKRSDALGMGLRSYIASGQLTLRAIDPAELSPGEFAAAVRSSVEVDGAKIVLIDSLNAYLQAMPDEKFLTLQMHELLTYLGQHGVATLLILGQHGIGGDIRADVDISYLADTVMLLRFFEADGEVRQAISVTKTRTTRHERMIREMQIRDGGLHVGAPLRDFDKALTGIPMFRGDPDLLIGDGMSGGRGDAPV